MDLKLARQMNKLSQEEAAKLIGVTNATISNWEIGKSQPQLKHVKKILEIYNVEYADIDWEE